MPATDSCQLPPTFTPVFDASNRWAAIRVRLAQGFRLDNGLLATINAALASEKNTEAAAHNLLPLLVEAEDAQVCSQALADSSMPCQIHLLFPASSFSAIEAQPSLAELKQKQVTLVARVADTMPEATNAGNSEHSAQALGIDVSEGLNGHDPALLQTFTGPNVAMNIDSHATHRQCLNVGFQWFEGIWALQPDPEQGPQSTTSRNTLLKLLGLVSSDADSREIEALLKRDPNLSCQLLKLVNSVGFSLAHKIKNFNQAITLLGRRQLQRWLQLLLYAGHHTDGGSSALLGFAARRAAFMESLATATGDKRADKDHAFMVGLFSLLDVLFKMPISELITPLNLEDEVTLALVARTGTLGRLLDLAIAAEATPDDVLMQTLDDLAVAPESFVRAQLQAIAWAAQVSKEM